MPCQLQHSDTVFYWLNISALIIYERFLSNNFGPKMIRLKQHFWQIYLFGQTKNQYFVPIWALCRYSVGTLKTLRYSATQDTRVLAALWHSRNSRNSGTQDTRKLTLTCQINGGRGGLSWGVRNVRFLENLACFVYLKHPFWDSPFCLITDEFRK